MPFVVIIVIILEFIVFQFVICSCTKEVVHSMQELHKIGTFCSIMELQDLGDKIRMIVQAHRRVRLIGQVVVDDEEPIVPDSDKLPENKKRTHRRRNKVASSEPIPKKSSEESSDTNETENHTEKQNSEPDPHSGQVPLLMVETENVTPTEYTMSPEIKVGIRILYTDMCFIDNFVIILLLTLYYPFEV